MKPDLLRAERKRCGWSQAQLAEALGITPKTVTRWELGITMPFPYHREKLSALFGKTLQELGFPQNTDENDALKRAVRSRVSDVSLQTSFLTDPTIPVQIRSTDPLRRRDDLLMLVRASLFAEDTVFVTGLSNFRSIGKTPLALALATDRQVQAHFRGGILWAELGPHPDVLGVLTR